MKYLLPLLVVLAIYFTYEYPVYAQNSASDQKHQNNYVREITTDEAKKLREELNKAGERFQKDKLKIASDQAKVRARLIFDQEQFEQRTASREAEMKQRMASREAELKQRLTQWQNKQKAMIVERINAQLQKINQQVTDRMTRQLDNMSARLLKAPDEATSGAYFDSTAYEPASLAISNARSAVSSQAAKSYSITISTEQNAKTDAKTARDNLFNDLKKLQEVMLSAKQAVAKVHQAQ